MKRQQIVGNVAPGHSNAHVEARAAKAARQYVSRHRERPTVQYQFSNHLKAEGAGDAQKVRIVSFRNTTQLAGGDNSIVILLNHSRYLTKQKAGTEKRHNVVILQRIMNRDKVA